MAESKAISIRVPDLLLERIDRLAKEQYKSHRGIPNRSQVVLDAIVAYFNTLSDTSNIDELITVSDSVSIIEFNELRDIVTTLSGTVKQLEDRLFTTSDSVNNLDASIESKPINENLLLSQSDVLTVSDSVYEKIDSTPSLQLDLIEGESVIEIEPTVVSLNMGELSQRLKVPLSQLRASSTSEESWRELMESNPDPESVQWSLPVKVGRSWKINSIVAR